jgi:hypothetical protein
MVRAAPVEAAVHGGLDAAAGRLEGGGHGQGGRGHGQAGALGQQPAQAEHDGGVAQAEQDGEQAVGQGAADNAVQVIEAVAQDGRPDGQGQEGHTDHARPGTQVHLADRDQDGRGQHRQAGQGGGQGHPAQLLALGPAGPAEPDDQRRGAGQDGEEADQQGELDGDPQDAAVDLGVEWPGDELGERVQRPRGDGGGHQGDGHRDRQGPGPPAPAGRRRRPGRGEQQHEPDRGQHGGDRHRVDPGHDVRGGQRPGADDQAVGDVADGRPAHPHVHAHRQQQPADRVPRAAAGQHRADDAGGQRRHRRRDRERVHGAQVGPAGLPVQVVEPGDGEEQQQLRRQQRPGEHDRPPAPWRRPGGTGGLTRRIVVPDRLVCRRHPASDPRRPRLVAPSIGAVRDGAVTAQRCTVPGRTPRAASSSRVGRPSQSPGTVTANAPQAAAVARRSGTGRPGRR